MRAVLTVAILVLASLPLAAQPRESLPGATNYTRVEATVACGGATSPEAFTELRSRGFAAIVNLRQADEPGAEVESASRAAREAGLRYLHIPMSSSSPLPEAFDAFLAAVSDPANSPVYIHCASANRVGAVWLAKRMIVDGWDRQRALAEAEAIGLRSPVLRDFALEYVERQRAATP